MTYNECKSYFNISNTKWIYKENFNKVNKKKGTELGCWGFCVKNGLFGILTPDGKWHWLNVLNTHPYCFYLLIKLYEEFTGNKFYVKNELYFRSECEKLFKFIEDNWELFFTKNKGTKYYHMFAISCNRSWVQGQYTTISVALSLNDLLPEFNILSYEYDLERGNLDDFDGKDIFFKTDDREYSIQVKSGSFYFDEKLDSYIVTSSANDLKSKADFYCFVEVSENETKIILFKNDITKIKNESYKTIFKKDLYMNDVTKNLEVTQKLMEIAKFCAPNNILFNLMRSESENTFEIISEPEITFNVSIGDFQDSSILPILEEKLVELNNLIK